MVSRSEQISNLSSRERSSGHFLESKEGVQALLGDHVERLRDKHFPVGDDARIDLVEVRRTGSSWDTDAYAELMHLKGNVADSAQRQLITQKFERDERTADRLKRKFEQRSGREGSLFSQEKTAELLEIMKTTSASEWFGDDFIAVRTSRYDDYVNGVDEIIINRETRQPFAAVDTTLNRDKFELHASFGEQGRTYRDVVREGAHIDHGVRITSEDEISIGPLDNLPIFIISVDAERVVEWAHKMEKSTVADRARLGLEIRTDVLEDLVDQSKEASRTAINDELKERYEEYRILFENLINEMM